MLVDARGIPRNLWPSILERLVVASVAERRAGLPALSSTRVRYVREPRGRELWQSAGETYRIGTGDCEDLAIYLAADLRVLGVPARVHVKPTARGYHALVEVGPNLFDPSRVRGMLKGAVS